MLLPFVAQSTQVLADGPTINGYVDTQYGYNFDAPGNGTTFGRSYDAQDNNIANTAHLSISGMFNDNTNYVVDIDAGHDANTTVGGTNNASAVVLQEAYVNYVGASKLGFKVGKFATYQGIEVIETNANPTISRGYLFGMAEPFTHVGGVVTLALGKLDFAAGFVNGWDVANDNNPGKTFVGKIGLNLGDALAATLSGYHGPEQTQSAPLPANNVIDGNSGNNRDSIDLTILTKIIPSVDLFLQGNAGTEENAADTNGAVGGVVVDDRASWSGVGVQPVVHFGDKFSVGGRVEYFADPQGVRSGSGINNTYLTNFTFTPGYKINDNLLVRAEYRYDTSNKKVWVDDKGKAQDDASTGTVQFVVSF